MIRDEVKDVVKDKGLSNVEYYDSSVSYKEKFEAVINFLSERRPWLYITNTYVLLYDNDNGLAISTDDVVDTLTMPDIRNKLTPITTLISLVQREKDVPQDIMDSAIEGANNSVKYLSGN